MSKLVKNLKAKLPHHTLVIPLARVTSVKKKKISLDVEIKFDRERRVTERKFLKQMIKNTDKMVRGK